MSQNSSSQLGVISPLLTRFLHSSQHSSIPTALKEVQDMLNFNINGPNALIVLTSEVPLDINNNTLLKFKVFRTKVAALRNLIRNKDLSSKRNELIILLKNLKMIDVLILQLTKQPLLLHPLT